MQICNNKFLRLTTSFLFKIVEKQILIKHLQTFIATSPIIVVQASIHAKYIQREVDKDKHKSCCSHPFGSENHCEQIGLDVKSAKVKWEILDLIGRSFLKTGRIHPHTPHI